MSDLTKQAESEAELARLIVKTLNLDAPGKFEVSDAGSILATLS